MDRIVRDVLSVGSQVFAASRKVIVMHVVDLAGSALGCVPATTTASAQLLDVTQRKQIACRQSATATCQSSSRRGSRNGRHRDHR